jgi:hypothetical protein
MELRIVAMSRFVILRSWMDGCQRCHDGSVIVIRNGLQRGGWTQCSLPVQLCAPLMPLSKHNSFCLGLASGCILRTTWKGENRMEKRIQLLLYEIKGSLLPSWLSIFLWFWFAARNFKKKRRPFSTRLLLHSEWYTSYQNVFAPSISRQISVGLVLFSDRKVYRSTEKCS